MLPLDTIFGSLSNPTRRDILARVTASDLTVSEVAKPYDVSLAAVSKHLKVLENSGLISKHRQGTEFIVSSRPQTLSLVDQYLAVYRIYWHDRFDALDEVLTKNFPPKP